MSCKCYEIRNNHKSDHEIRFFVQCGLGRTLNFNWCNRLLCNSGMMITKEIVKDALT